MTGLRRDNVLWYLAYFSSQRVKTTTIDLFTDTAAQGPKLRLPGRQCDHKFSSGDQNFIVVASWRLVRLVVIVDFHVRRK